MAISFCVLLWSHPGQRDALIRYEDAVLALLSNHGGRVLHRVVAEAASDGPIEVQILEFDEPGGVDSFMADPRRVALAAERVAAISRTELLPLAGRSAGDE